MPRRKRVDPERDAAEFNEKNPTGTPVTYWTGIRKGPGKSSATMSMAQVLGGHTAVVWVEDHGSCIALTHIRVDETQEAAG